MRNVAVAGLMLLSLQPVSARTLDVCVSDADAAPFSYPDREGQGQFLLRHAAARAGDGLRIIVEPRRRCLDNVERGRYQVLMVASNAPSMLGHYAYPMRDGALDPARSIGAIDNYVVRLKGSAVAWDGQRLTGLTRPVLHLFGRRSTIDRLAEMRIPASDAANLPQQLVEMLLSGRGEAAIMTEREWRAVQTDPRVGQRLELLAPAFQHLDIYCAFNRQFAADDPDYVERMWNEFPRIRASREWEEFLESLGEGMASGAAMRRRRP
jgi:ABC-type amino acid transport substrate-binding protein